LAEATEKPPYHLTPETVWQAYKQLEEARVKGAGPQKLLTNIISLLRFALGESEVLEPFPMTVQGRYARWLAEQERMGRRFTPEQQQWLGLLCEHIAASLSISLDDLDYAPFYARGGRLKVYQLFGPETDKLFVELSEVLVA